MLFVAGGCKLGDFANGESSQTTNSTEASKNAEKTQESIKEFAADPFADAMVLSWMYSINLKKIEDNIYLNDLLCDSCEMISNPEITYNEASLRSVNKEVTDQEVFDVMEKIKSSDSCYMLRVRKNDGTIQEISAYNVDGMYYFLTFYPNIEGQLLRIHRLIVD